MIPLTLSIGLAALAIWGVHAREGDILWTFRAPDYLGTPDQIFDSPVLATHDSLGTIVYFTTTHGFIYGLNPTDGKSKFVKNVGLGVIKAKPSVKQDGSVMYINTVTKKTVAINAATGDQIWSLSTTGLANRAPLIDVVDESVLYVYDESDIISFIDISDGDIIRSITNVFTQDVFRIGQNPVNGDIYYNNKAANALVAINRNTGFPVWIKNMSDIVQGIYGYSETTLYIYTQKGHVYEADATNGDYVSIFKTATDAEIFAPPFIDGTNNIMYVSDMSGHVSAVNLNTKAVIWTKDLAAGWITSGVVVSKSGVAYVGTGDGNVFALDAATGDLRWKFRTLREIFNVPVLSADHRVLYVTSFDGRLRAHKTDLYDHVSTNTTNTTNTNSSLTTNTPSATTKAHTFVEKNTLFIVSVSLFGCAVAVVAIVVVRMY